MNVIDLLVVGLVVGSIARGLRIGLLRQSLSTGGFIFGLLIGSWLAKFAVQGVNDAFYRFLVIITVDLFMAGIFMSLGDTIGLHLRRVADKVRIGTLDEILGGVFEAMFVLLAAWVIASGVTNVQAANLGALVRHSFIIQKLNNNLPTPPDVLAQLDKVINPNTFPGVFIGAEPRHKQVPLPVGIDPAVIAKDEAAVVKIEGYGCGGVVEGTGFVSQNGIVVTNAHVIAGVPKPMVLSNGRNYKSRPIWFDENLDLAVLKVEALPNDPIPLSNEVLPDGSPAVVLGYPSGGPLAEAPASVIDTVHATGRNIYNRGIITRHIYELSVDVEPGNSGGPVVGADGAVHGIVFGKSLSQNNIGYALTSAEAITGIQQAVAAQRQVATGQCTEP